MMDEWTALIRELRDLMLILRESMARESPSVEEAALAAREKEWLDRRHYVMCAAAEIYADSRSSRTMENSVRLASELYDAVLRAVGPRPIGDAEEVVE